MTQSNRFIALAAVAMLTAGLTGCSPTPPATAAPSGAPPVATSTPAPTSASGLPDLTLTNVKTEIANARGASIGPDGGTISATGSNGAVYTLTLPADAVEQDTQIALYPVTSLANLPAGASITAGVQFSPEGLRLGVAARLTIQLPAGVDTSKLAGLAWGGDGDRAQLYPALVDGQTLTLHILHFSGGGAAPQTLPLEPLAPCEPTDLPCRTSEMERSMADVELRPGATVDDVLSHLRFWYYNLVAPAMNASINASGRRPPDPDAEEPVADVYYHWLDAIESFGEYLHDPTLTVNPELAQSKDLAVAFLLDWYTAENAQCVAQQDNTDIQVPLGWASEAMSAELDAYLWEINTKANRLDLGTLLRDLCVQVVIDPSRSYSGVLPDDNGTIKIKAGFTIGSGPFETSADQPIRVKLSIGSTVLADQDTDQDGMLSVPLTWPAGVDPIKIDILATLTDPSGGPGWTPNRIVRFDRITKPAEKLAWTFDSGLDGWSGGHVGRKGSTSDWGTVGWSAVHGGSIKLDGEGRRDTQGHVNAWISKEIQVPSGPWTLTFQVSAQKAVGADADLVVYVVDLAGGQTTLPLQLDEIVVGRPDRYVFTQRSIDLSPWAGQTIRVFIEQNDNGFLNSEGVREFHGHHEELFIDNVRIS